MKTNKILATFAMLAAVMMAATFIACSSDDDDNKVNKPTLGKTVTWDINTQGNANVPAGEKWIITGTGKDTPHYITIGDGATVTLSGVNIDAYNTKDPTVGFVPAITCLGDATIILADGTTNILNGNPYPGIVVLTDKKVGTLTIKGTGSLEAKSSNGAGIGCPWNNEDNLGVKMDCGNIVIESGNITATGFQEAPGIGGSGTNKCGNITIKGGNVTATGGFGPGIGCCGSESACGNILITGGKVTATGGDWGPAIGRDDMGMGTCGTITIGGTVYWDGWGYQNGGETYLTTKPFVYEQ